MPVDFVDFVRSESDRFAAVLDDLEPTADVPSCPGWDASDLLWHLGEVQYFWSRVVGERLTDPNVLDVPDRPEGWSALADFFRTANAALVEALETTPADTPVWSFTVDRTARFARRRQAHEALIHRVDAELTAGIEPQIDAELATDGAFEVLEWMFAGTPPWADLTVDGAIGRVSTTDTHESRLVRLGRWSGTSPRSGKTYTDQPRVFVVDSGTASFEVSGAARDLDLWMWNRPMPGEVSLSGDSHDFERLIAEGVQ